MTVVIPEQDGHEFGFAPAGPQRSILSTGIADQLTRLIREGVYAEGERLPAERDLAVQLQVSRIIVREALRALSERGLVETRPGVGTFVAALDSASATRMLSQYIQHHHIDAAHLFEVRRLLEPAMAAQAAQRASGAALSAMRANLQRTAAIVERFSDSDGQAEAFAWIDLEFHELLASATGNPLYEVLLNPLLDNLLDLRRAGMHVTGSVHRAYDDHRRIFERITSGDASAARRAMREHLDAVETWVTVSRRTGKGAADD